MITLKYHIFSILIGVLFLFYSLLPQNIVAILLIGYIGSSVKYLKKSADWFNSILITSIYLIPLSFISIIGTSTVEFPIAWFHFAVITLAILSLKNVDVSPQYHFYIGLFALFGFFNCISQRDIADAFKQFLIIILFFFTFYVSEAVRNKKQYLYPALLESYTGSTIIISLQVIIQKYMATSYGIMLGHLDNYAERTAWGGLMGDYSFTTLYIATGIMLVILYYLEYKKINLYTFLILSGILAYGQISVSSRTGWVALGAGFLLYLFDRKKRIKIGRLFLLITAFIIAIPYFFDMLLSNRADITSSSGREENYIAALDYFLDNFLVGVGLGLNNLYQQTREGVPHNFFIQYLVQVGIIGTLIITLPFIHFWKQNVRNTGGVKYLFVIVAIGSMFIPDIVSSRFLYGVLILIAASNKSVYHKIKNTL